MDTFNLRKFLKENKLKEFDDSSIEQYGDAMKQTLGDDEAPAHITALAIAAEDAYEAL